MVFKGPSQSSLINNRTLSAAQIQSNKRLRFSNTISYTQAHRLKQALLEEIESKEADCPAKFPAYMEQLVASDPESQSALAIDEDNRFEATAFAPAAIKYAFQ
jgi:hypothetical protein